MRLALVVNRPEGFEVPPGPLGLASSLGVASRPRLAFDTVRLAPGHVVVGELKLFDALLDRVVARVETLLELFHENLLVASGGQNILLLTV